MNWVVYTGVRKEYIAQKEIAAAYAYQVAKEHGDHVVIGVNKYREEQLDIPFPLHRVHPETERRQIERLTRVKVVARALRDAGMEVIYTGLHQTPEQVVNAAIQEDVEVIGLSILSGAHMTIYPRILALLKEQDADDILVVGGGNSARAARRGRRQTARRGRGDGRREQRS